MLHVRRDGGSVGSRRGNRSRMVALVSTFLLLSAGMVVSLPGLMSASATSGSSSHQSGGGGSGNGGDDNGSGGSGGGSGQGSCKSGDDKGGDDSGDDKSGGDNSGSDSSGSDSSGSDTSKTSSDSASIASTDSSSTDSSGTDSSGTDQSGGSKSDDDTSGDSSGSHDGTDDGNDDDGGGNCLATLTLNKKVINDNGGTATIADFTLTATSSTGGVAVISGVDPNVSPTVGISAQVPVTDTYVLSETNMDGYDASAWHCSAGTLAGDVLTLAAGDVANCTITNNDTPPPPVPTTIKVDKLLLDNQWGGTLAAADFQLKIDGTNVAQGVAIDVLPGTHVISELQRPGYEQVEIDCVDLANNTAAVAVAGSVEVAEGQNFHCIVANQEIPPMLTVTKSVTNDNGGTAVSSDFQLQVDGVDAGQGTANATAVVAGTAHTVGEVPTAGYRLVSIVCTDDDTNAAVPYNSGVTLALGQHVTCNLTNDDDPIDLVITKTSDGLSKIAGGASFNYTITVDNLGPRDASPTESVTVTDQLPAGLSFVTVPSNCTIAGQTLTCDLLPADLHVADAPVVLTVTVKANADAASGTYTNMAWVDTPGDPSCVGNSCVPVCNTESNNVACASTTITRTAGIAIDKHSNVTGTINPGATFNYLITVSNTGPSTFLTGMTMTDNLPAGLSFVSISAASPWSCNTGLSILCVYGGVLFPGAAPVITITVTVDLTYTGPPIHNVATANASFNTPATLQALDTAAPTDPGTVTVTATDDETTPVALIADLSIDKSVSQATATAGDQFNWILDITNHGPDTATNVVVSDTIPASFVVVGTSPTAGLSCTNTANSVSCTAATLANGATVRAVVQVRVVAAAAPGAVTNTATVVADSTDPNTADNSDSASITITAAGSQAPVPPAASSGSTRSTSGITLPRTGNGSLTAPLTLAGLLLFGGISSLVIARRRRAATA